MKCINCGVNLNEGATYCVRCGTFQNSESNINNNVNVISSEQNKDISCDILVQAYVGNKYNKFKYGGFSWMYFFFGPFYGFCRRMYGFSLLHLFALFLTGFASLIGIWFELICVLIINLFFCFTFKNSYIEKVKSRVKKIIFKNPNLDMVMLQEKCKKKGGISIFWLIIGIILPIVISFAVFIIAFSATSNLVNYSRYKSVESGAKMYIESLEFCTSLESDLNEAIKKCDVNGVKYYFNSRIEADVIFELDKDINTNKIIVKSFEYNQSGYTIKLVDSYKKVDKNTGQFISKNRDLDSVQLALNNIAWGK